MDMVGLPVSPSKPTERPSVVRTRRSATLVTVTFTRSGSYGRYPRRARAARILSSCSACDSINFADTGAGDEYTTYAYDSYYIDNGNAFANDAEIFVGAEDTNTFAIDGPKAPSGIDGGPYPGFVEIPATTGAASTIIARLCVVFATSE